MSSPTHSTTLDSVQTRVIDVVETLVSELRRSDGHRRVYAGDSLERDLGISSLERVELLVRLEQAFGIRLGETAMVDANTPKDLAIAILSAKPTVAYTSPEIQPTPTETSAAPTSANTIIDALESHANHTPDRVHIYLRDENGNDRSLTYGELWQASVAIANGLTTRGLRRHETVAIMLRTEMTFFSSFFGILLAGGVPVPLYPPVRADRIEEYAERQVGILRNADTRMMITFAEVERVATLLVGQAPSLSNVVTAETLGKQSDGEHLRYDHVRCPDNSPALIQYTSGSTGNPNGVLLSHKNLLANIRAIQQGLGIRPDDVGVSWLPLYHDMGLIGAWLGTLYMGIPLVLMSPLTFLVRPVRWLQAFHDYRATISPAPNFAYDLCSRRIDDDELKGLDLSSVRILLNGSEAVLPETLNRFATRFAPYGLKPESLCPVYGLAECAVGLAATPVGGGPKIDRIDRQMFQESGLAVQVHEHHDSPLRVVSAGRVLPDHELRVVNSNGIPVADRNQGHIQFRGPSATAGYYRNPEATRELIGRDGWLNTGDLGYFADGDLFLTGRQKDLIIKGGRNLHPHEAEEIAGAVDGVRAGCVAAFGIPDINRGTERFVVVAETRLSSTHDRDLLQANVTQRIAIALGIPPDVVVLAPPGAVFKTSSGKIRRAATRKAFLSGDLTKSRPAVLTQWTRLVFRSMVARLRRWGGTFFRIGYTAYVTVLLLVTAPIVWSLLVVGPRGDWVNRLIGGWTRIILPMCGCPVNVVGLDNLQQFGPAVYVANHASYLDAVLMMSVLPVKLRFAAKGRLTRYPVLGTAIRKGNHITIEKSDFPQLIAGAGAVVETVREGESLFVFPEGTFVDSPGLLPFRLGAFRAAVETSRPIVPIAISGTRHILTAKTKLLRPGRITVTISPPLVPSAKNWQEIVRLRDTARAVIEKAAHEQK